MGYHIAYVGPIKNDQYFYNTQDMSELFHESYAVNRSKSNPINYDFTIRDPFNTIYNPAKISTKNRHVRFNQHFESALKHLLIK